MTERFRFKKAELSSWKGPAGALVLGGLICQMGVGFGYVLGSLAGDIIGELGWTRTMYSSARAPQLFVIALCLPLQPSCPMGEYLRYLQGALGFH